MEIIKATPASNDLQSISHLQWFSFCFIFSAKRDTFSEKKKRKEIVTDCPPPLLSLDSSCCAASVVRQCGRPAACVCVWARDRLLPIGKHQDQCNGAAYRAWTNVRGPTWDRCVTIDHTGHHRKRGLYLSFILMYFCVRLFFTAIQRPFDFVMIFCYSVV